LPAARNAPNVASGADPQVALLLRAAEQATERDRLSLMNCRENGHRQPYAVCLKSGWRMECSEQTTTLNSEELLRRTSCLDSETDLAHRDRHRLRDALRKGRAKPAKRGSEAERMLSELRQTVSMVDQATAVEVHANRRQSSRARGRPSRSSVGYEPTIRDRVLAPQELQELRTSSFRQKRKYEEAPDRRTAPRPLQPEAQLALWICLGTACRIGELFKGAVGTREHQ